MPGPGVKTEGEEGVNQRNPSRRRSWSHLPSLAAPQLAFPWEPEFRKQKVLILRTKTWALLVVPSYCPFYWVSLWGRGAWGGERQRFLAEEVTTQNNRTLHPWDITYE